MNCPHCHKRLPAHLIDTKAAGSKGGSATGPRKARTSEQARAAALAGVAKRKEAKAGRTSV